MACSLDKGLAKDLQVAPSKVFPWLSVQEEGAIVAQLPATIPTSPVAQMVPAAGKTAQEALRVASSNKCSKSLSKSPNQAVDRRWTTFICATAAEVKSVLTEDADTASEKTDGHESKYTMKRTLFLTMTSISLACKILDVSLVFLLRGCREAI